MSDVRIISHGGTAEIYVDGIPMQEKCTAFSFEQSAIHGGILKLELLCHRVTIEGTGVDVIKRQEERQESRSSE